MKQNLLIPFLLLAAACGEETTTMPTSAIDMPVVESYLIEGATELTVKLYGMEVYLKDDYVLSRPIGGLKLQINGRKLTETVSGTYTLNLGDDTVRGQQHYELAFEYLGQTITASTDVPRPVSNLSIEPEQIVRASGASFFDESDTTAITLTWDDPGNDYYQVYIESPETTYMPGLGGTTSFRRRMMQPFQGGEYRTTSREFRATGSYHIYVYRVNKEYADLYERASATDLANPTSSINNAFGIFTAMSVANVVFYVTESEE
ncbi:MAG: hypothetical protein LBH04_01895 [Tannerellaceae bacterium]|jgi:hypothetical protein|nr:hypothetical protein [Tannerellaceae bacterium]